MAPGIGGEPWGDDWVHPKWGVLGLNADIYYLREGVKNDYALNFTVTIPADVPGLHFTWENLSNKPVAYEITMDYNNHLAMDEPRMNISDRGLLPRGRQVFRIDFPCTGAENAEVDITLSVNITTVYELSSLRLRRKKICLKHLVEIQQQQNMNTNNNNNHVHPANNKKQKETKLADEGKRVSVEDRIKQQQVAEVEDPAAAAAAGGSPGSGSPDPPGVPLPDVRSAQHDGGTLAAPNGSVAYIATGSVCGVIVTVMMVILVLHFRRKRSQRGPGRTGLQCHDDDALCLRHGLWPPGRLTEWLLLRRL
ncbi:unnamed protein product [Notodromas monacha]|uniref:WIF domain-containing protein n=1 Tax=Notodromas monacha TaxID=399045 RepID=A0A7R9GCB8_9CRUS|nr:unnamed protein product [Notodromas monacha]CAG0917300.1 unnamed protein product [Notodromas monacha]